MRPTPLHPIFVLCFLLDMGNIPALSTRTALNPVTAKDDEETRRRKGTKADREECRSLMRQFVTIAAANPKDGVPMEVLESLCQRVADLKDRVSPPRKPGDMSLRLDGCVQQILKTGLIDSLGIALTHIDALPADFKAKFDEYFDAEAIEDVRLLWSGLKKLGGGTVPTRDEWLAIACPNSGELSEIAWGLRDAATVEEVSPDLAAHIDADIFEPLDAAEIQVKDFDLWIRDWAYEQADFYHAPPAPVA